jgi:hypothetical protein
MATKKKTEETEVKVEEKTADTKEIALAEELKRIKEERDALLKANQNLKAEVDEYNANDLDLEGEHDDAYWNERINYVVPFYGDDETVMVRVNDENVMVVRGEEVNIKRKFAAVLEQQKIQRMYSNKYNKSLSDKFENDTKKLGL